MTNILISRLEEKFQLLLIKMQSLREENQHLQDTVNNQKKEIGEQQNNIKGLEHKLELLKIASMAGGDKQDASENRKQLRSTINKYIREIDHCIAQLNE